MSVQTMPVQSAPEQTPSGQNLSEPGAPTRSWRDRCLAAVLLTLPLSLFGEILVRRTHHRPLGAATFASVTIVGFLLVWPLTGALRQRWTPRVGTWPVYKWIERVLWALGAVGLLVVIGRLIG